MKFSTIQENLKNFLYIESCKLYIVLKKEKIDLAIFTNFQALSYNENIYYLTGYTGLGALAVPKSGKPFLLVPPLDYTRARKSKLSVYKWEKGTKLFRVMADILKKKKVRYKTIGIEKSNTTLKSYNYMRTLRSKKKVKDISDLLLKIREKKKKEEIAALRKACKLADQVLQKTIQNIRKFKTEAGVAAFLEYETKKLGCDLSFPTIVASGSNSGMPHHTPKNTKLKKGFCIIDFGVKYKGYCSDITRTIFLGKPTMEHIKAYSKVLRAQKECIKMCTPGKKCSDIHDYAYQRLGAHFIHGLGHGIGVEIHELPSLKPKSKDILAENMVLTIEPGIYYPNKFGIRIEDDILITKNKPVQLTKTTKNLLIIR